MAYPDYSIVVVDVTTNGITEPVVFVHFDEQLSKKYFNSAILGGHRAFYYEKPKPNDFNRNDTQPIINATVAEAALLSSSSVIAFTKDPVADALVDTWIDNIDSSWTMVDNTLNAIQSGSSHVGERIGQKFFNSINNFYYNKFLPAVFPPRGTLIAQVTVENYTYSIRTNGDIGVYEEVIHNCPAEGTVLGTSTDVPYTQFTTFGGVEITLGTFSETVTADGNCESTSDKTYEWSPYGTVLGQRLTEEQLVVLFKSNGNGWYFEELAPVGGGGGTTTPTGEPNCDPAGTENEALRSETETVFWLFNRNGAGEFQSFQFGTSYTKFMTDGNCGYTPVSVTDWLPYQTLLHVDISDDGYITTQYFCDGNGGVYAEVDDQTPPQTPIDPHADWNGYCLQNPQDAICQCPAQGATKDWAGYEFPEVTIPVNINFQGDGFNFTIAEAGFNFTNQVADGNCGYTDIPSSEQTEWNLSESDILYQTFDNEMEEITICAFSTNGEVVVSKDNFAVPKPRSGPKVFLNTIGTPPIPKSGNGLVEEGLWLTAGEFFLGGTFAGFQDGLKPRGVQSGDYRPQDFYAAKPKFSYEACSPRMNIEIGTAVSGFSPIEFWSASDGLEAESSSDNAKIKSKKTDRIKNLSYPTSSPYLTGEKHPIGSAPNTKGVLLTSIQTGWIYYGRRIAWNPAEVNGSFVAPCPENSRINLKWYSEEYLISKEKIPRDSRWNGPSVSEATSMRQRLGLGTPDAGTDAMKYAEWYVCPIFQQQMPLVRNDGQALIPIAYAGGPNPATITTHALGTDQSQKVKMADANKMQYYTPVKLTVKYDGKGSITWPK